MQVGEYFRQYTYWVHRRAAVHPGMKIERWAGNRDFFTDHAS